MPPPEMPCVYGGLQAGARARCAVAGDSGADQSDLPDATGEDDGELEGSQVELSQYRRRLRGDSGGRVMVVYCESGVEVASALAPNTRGDPPTCNSLPEPYSNSL